MGKRGLTERVDLSQHKGERETQPCLPPSLSEGKTLRREGGEGRRDNYFERGAASPLGKCPS